MTMPNRIGKSMTRYELTKVTPCTECNGTGETDKLMPGFTLRCPECEDGVIRTPCDLAEALRDIEESRNDAQSKT